MAAIFAIYARSVACFVAAWMLALSFAHAEPTVPALSNGLEGHLWQIESISRFDDAYPSDRDDPDGYLTFRNGEIGGSLGCGQLTGRYSFSNDNAQISAAWNDDTQHCSSNLRQQAAALTAALNGTIRLERGGEGAFHLSGKQRDDFVRLEVLSPGFDFSEFRATFWRLVSLEGNAIAEPNAVRIDAKKIEIFSDDYIAGFAFLYRNSKFSFNGPLSVAHLDGNIDLSPRLKAFGATLDKVASYAVNGDELAVLDSSGRQVMLLKRIRSTGLEYRLWRIAEYAANGELVHPVRPARFQVTFVRGKLRGIVGCKGLGGVYTLAGNSLSVQASDLSMGYCAPQDENEMRLVLAALDKGSQPKEDGARILLQDNQGNTNVVLTPVVLTSYLQQTPQ